MDRLHLLVSGVWRVQHNAEACSLGGFISQLFVPRVREITVMTALLLVQSFMACSIQFMGIGSSALFFISSLPLFLALSLNSAITRPGREVSMWTYAVGQAIPLTTGAQMMYGVLEVFVPLVSLLLKRFYTFD